MVLVRKRTLSKLESYMNARRLHKQLFFLLIRDFGMKPRAREPTFYTKGWEPQDKEMFETIVRKYGISRIVDDYPTWAISYCRRKILKNIDIMEENVTTAYTIWATNKAEAEARRLYQDKAIAACENLKQDFEFISEVLPLKVDKLLPYIDSISKEIALLKGWRKSDNKRNKDFK